MLVKIANVASVPLLIRPTLITLYLARLNFQSYDVELIEKSYSLIMRAMVSTSQPFFIGHINARSFQAKLLEIQPVVKDKNLHIIGVCDTFYKPEISVELMQIQNFRIFRVTRLYKNCGGVALYVHESINAKEVSH